MEHIHYITGTSQKHLQSAAVFLREYFNWLVKALIVIFILHITTNTAHAQKNLSLKECRRLALQNNTVIKNSKLEIESAKKTKLSALTKFFPQISAGAMVFKTKDPLVDESVPEVNLPVYDGNPANLASASEFAYFPGMGMQAIEEGGGGYVAAIQPVFAGGMIINGNRLAALGHDVSLLKYKMHQDEIILQTEEQYWQIVSLNEKMKTIVQYEELLKRLLKQVEASYNAGLTLKNDVLKVRQKVSDIVLKKSKLENGIHLAVMAFCQHLGIAHDPSITFTDELKIDTNYHPLRVKTSDAVKKRTEYTLLNKSLKAEKLKTQLKLGDYLPKIGIGVGVSLIKIDNYDWVDNQILFASAQLPISDWWGGTYEIQERKIQEHIASNDKDNKIKLLQLQIEKAWRDLEDAHKQLALSEISRSQAEENLNMSRDSYENGIVDISDLLEAQAIFQETENQLIDAKINYRIKQINYLQKTGRKF